MVNNKIAQRAVAAGLSGLMAFGAAAPAALAYTNYKDPFEWVKTKSNDDSTHWKRLAGDDRYGTMKAIVESYNEVSMGFWQSIRKGFNEKDYYNYHNTVVLASGDNFPDALAANGLAGYLTNSNIYNGDFQSVPVLITKANSLSTETKDLLKGMQVQNVIIMGGTAAISQDVEDAINKMGIGTQRVAGADRQETSVKAMQRINGNWEARDKTYDLIIAAGNNFADALSISPYAYRMGTPIILTNSEGKLTDKEVEAIKANDKIKEIVIVGGTDAVKDDVLGQIGTIKNNRAGINVVRIAGADRYETSAKIAEFETKEWSKAWSRYAPEGDFSFDHAVVATGEKFPDALVGGQLAGGVNAWGMIDVDGFSTKDFNDWSPCPLLLVKEGNKQAESMIAQGIAKNRVTTGTDTFMTAKKWIDTINNWYNGGVWTQPFSFLPTYTADATSWYESTNPSFISDKAIDASDPNGVEVAEVNDCALQFYFNVTKNNRRASLKIAALNDSGEWAKSVNGTFAFDNNEEPTKVTIRDLVVTEADGTEEFYDGDLIEITLTTEQQDEIIRLEEGRTYELVLPKTEVEMTTKGYIEGPGIEIKNWQNQIIGFAGSDEDFYGIILGGTAAVSNDIRDDLEDVVKNFGYDDDVTTVARGEQGTIRLIDDKGVANNYNYLEPEVAGVDYIGDIEGWLAGYYGDVYHVYGTDSHVVAVFDDDDDLVTWIYYYGKNSNLANDWAVPASWV